VLTSRAFAVLGGSAALWLGSRLLGTPDLHMVAVGLAVMVPLAVLLVRSRRHDLQATRRLSTPRAFPGARVTVELDVRNVGRRRTSLVLLEDVRPAGLGPPARAVVADLRPGARETVSYDLVAGARGRYPIGPLTALVTDPFDLARRPIQLPGQQELIVFPTVEDLGGRPAAAAAGGAGESVVRDLFRSGEEFYTMRGYELGDDLRRIHWPSVARTGELMIRQDESARRATAAVLLDNRERAWHERPEAFEQAVSAAASVGVHYLRGGFALRLATADRPPAPTSRDVFLDLLAVVRPAAVKLLTPAVEQLRGAATGGAAVIVVTRVPDVEEAAALTRLRSGSASRLAILVQDGAPPGVASEAAWVTLTRAGWDVLMLPPGQSLAERWRRRARRPAIAASS
jgi:uncharacterized protein (DUF58 family)